MEFNMGHSTKWLFLSTVFKLNWNVGFCGGGRIRGIVEKTLHTRMRTNNKFDSCVTTGLVTKHRPQWWEASPLTTAPSPLNIEVQMCCFF